MKADLIDLLNKEREELSVLVGSVRKSTTSRVSKKSILKELSDAAVNWFDNIKPELDAYSLDATLVTECSEDFEEILRLTKQNKPYKTVLLKALNKLISRIKNGLIHKIQLTPPRMHGLVSISPYLEGLPDDEKKYLEEAEKCAEMDCKRASVILGWCAVMDRVHRKIELLGFETFNKATVEMKNKNYGRFKPYNKSFNVESLSELRMIFDTDILWVLEYLELIDNNEHERLRHCFTMRNNSGHPGNAPMTGENLYSFYSDVTQIVLKNLKFQIS